MFNPSDLEGEVDHSFFDSDCDDDTLSNNCKKTMDKDVEASEKDNSPAREKLHAKQNSCPPKMEETEMMPPQSDNSSKAKTKEDCQKENDSGRASSASSVTMSTSERVNDNRFQHEQDSNTNPQISQGTFLGLLMEDTNGYDQETCSPNESEEELFIPKHSSANGRKRQSSKKQKRNRGTRCPTLTSSESSSDTELQCSPCSCGNKRGSADPSTLPLPRNRSVSDNVTRTKLDSESYVDVAASHTEESHDTDVSSLSSADSSLLQCLHPKISEDEEESLTEERKESVPSSGPGNMYQDEDLAQEVDACSLTSESLPGGQMVYSGVRHRKNYTFSNNEVQSIGRENRRLLRELSRISAGSRQGSVMGKKTYQARNSPLLRVSHSAINREREQKRIQRDNLAFMKRLESVKPTSGLSRSEQLADYQRHVLRDRLSPICVSTTKQGSSNYKTPSSRSQVTSAASRTPKS